VQAVPVEGREAGPHVGAQLREVDLRGRACARVRGA
jgi:hypothetical protein